jgi:outer membrane murein-binding lipoprotein Lpp
MGGDESIQAALREMSEKIGGLNSTVGSLVSQWARQETAASDGRSRLHSKIEEVKDSVTKLDGRVDNLSTKVTAIEPAMKAFEKEELRQEGAKRLGAKIWAAMLLATGLAGWGVHEAISWIFRH